jgi:glucose/arabinose dehydrogenase
VAALILALGCQTASGAPARGTTPSTQSRTFDPSSTRLRLERVADGFRDPTMIAVAGDGSGRLFVTERPGRISVIEGGQRRDAAFLDITGRVGSRGQEQGLLSVAFHPRYVENKWLYVNYTDLQGTTVISRFTVSEDGSAVDPGSEHVLLTIAQPAANHNGGLLVFGPDGFLYVGMGDGGGAGDQFRNAQNRATLLGKMLRLDVDRGDTYEVPPDNPFVNTPEAAPEVFAYGLRNPWRFAFDGPTGELYIADVGQNRYEWVHHQNAGTVGGQNYGWPIVEGFHCYPSGEGCDRAGLETPIAEYGHDRGCSVSGGFVYRGQMYSQVQGVYFFADFCSGRVWALDWSAEAGWRQTEIANTGMTISTFGQDENNELYLATFDSGAVYRVVFE